MPAAMSSAAWTGISSSAAVVPAARAAMAPTARSARARKVAKSVPERKCAPPSARIIARRA